MPVYTIDPLVDPRWTELVGKHPGASVFHTAGWMRSLRDTYSYQPVVYTTCSSEQELTNGIPFCRVISCLTGRRLVSLPFSDHCQPLVNNPDELREILSTVTGEVDDGVWKYVELRPLETVAEWVKGLDKPVLGVSEEYLWFTLDLNPELDNIYKSFHRSSVRERINRSKREELEYRDGRSDDLIRDFFRLLVSTRKKHQVPPQPFEWFRNLRDCLGEDFTVRVSYKDGEPTAATVDLGFRTAHCSKYSASDQRFSRLGGTQLLRWNAITTAKEAGASVFDMCRCEPSNEGLAAYKSEWGTASAALNYYRYPAPVERAKADRKMEVAGRVFSRLPSCLLVVAGKLLYKHVG